MQYYVFFPEVQKDAYLFYLVNELSSSSMIIFTSTVDRAQRLSIMLNRLGYPAIPLHGQMSQSARLGSLNKFKSGGRKILVATDVASRGLDIPSVDLVIVSTAVTPGTQADSRTLTFPPTRRTTCTVSVVPRVLDDPESRSRL